MLGRFPLVIAAITLLNFEALAFVGSQDFTNRFPYVVQLKSPTGLCTGVLGNGGIISTAAHCVWDGKKLTSIEIEFRDVDGNIKTAQSQKIFIPSGYPAAYATWEKSRTSLDFNKMSLLDIAFVVPSSDVSTGGIKDWITDVLMVSPRAESDDENFAVYKPNRPLLTDTFKAKIKSDIAIEIGNLENASAMVVGFGNNFCKDFARSDQCISDGNRRFGEIPLTPVVEERGERFEAPWLWCTGTDSSGLSPVRSGDSGGPLFIRTLDGRWLFAGHISGGNAYKNCASSLFMHLHLWRDAVYYAVKNGLTVKPNPLEKRQMARLALQAYLESWSSENSAALRRAAIYRQSAKQFVYNSKAVRLDDLLQEKRSFAAAWPKRSYKIISGSPVWTACGTYEDFLGMQTCRVRAQVEWQISNPESSKNSRGTSEIDVLMNIVGLQTDWLNVGPPRFDVENWKTLTQDGRTFAMAAGSFKMGNIEINQNLEINEEDTAKLEADYGVCYNLCYFDDSCAGYSYIRSSGQCRLKSSARQTRRNPAIVSGIRRSQ